MGVGPFVLTILTAPVEFLLGEPFASLFWPAVQFLAVVFGAVVVSMADLDTGDDRSDAAAGPEDPPTD
jgi:hypothetical protein